jgi:hypothetical protein
MAVPITAMTNFIMVDGDTRDSRAVDGLCSIRAQSEPKY